MRPIGLLLALVCGCRQTDADACAAGGPEIELGLGVGSTFAPLVDGAEVEVSAAPQGGFGVPVAVRTRGFAIGLETLVEVEVVSELAGASIGEYRIGGVGLLCESHAVGGTIPGVIVGFDPMTYPTMTELAALDGETVTLGVTVDAPDGSSASAQVDVVVELGG